MFDNAKTIKARAEEKMFEAMMETEDYIQYELSKWYTRLVGKVGEVEANKRMKELIGL